MKASRFVLLALTLLLTIGLNFPARAQEPVVIRWWLFEDSNDQQKRDYWQSLAETYMAQNPHVRIETTYISQRIVTLVMSVHNPNVQGSDNCSACHSTVPNSDNPNPEPPHLIQTWGGAVLWDYGADGLLRDIAPELEANDNGWKDLFAASALELYGQNGAYYGVPFNLSVIGIFYNRALFAQAGLDPDNPPATWTEFLDAVQTLKDAGITPISLGGRDIWTSQFWWTYLALRMGGRDAFMRAYTREGSFADEPFVQAGEYLQELIALEPFPQDFMTLGYNDQETLMGNGEAAMNLMGTWSIAAQAANSASGEGIGDDLGWFPFPAVEDGAGHPDDVYGGGDGFAVLVDAPDETVDFLKFIASVENQRAAAEVGITPVVLGTEDVYADNPPMLSMFEARNNAPYFQLYYDQFLPTSVGGAVFSAVNNLFTGVGTPEDAAQDIESAASRELD
jgi:raffinose/stachyose/melibiose transport system substrate-binding protein